MLMFGNVHHLVGIRMIMFSCYISMTDDLSSTYNYIYPRLAKTHSSYPMPKEQGLLAIRSFSWGSIYCNRVILWLPTRFPIQVFFSPLFQSALQLSELPVKIFGSVYTAYISIAYIGPTWRVLENVLRFVSYFCTWCQWNLDNLRFKVHGWRRHPGYLLKIRED